MPFKASITAHLTGRLELTVNEHKSRVVKTNDCEFLGFTFRERSCVGPIAPSTTSSTASGN